MYISEFIKLGKLIFSFSDRQQQIIKARFGLKDGVFLTLEEVGREFDVTRERVRQIEEKVLIQAKKAWSSIFKYEPTTRDLIHFTRNFLKDYIFKN